MSSSCLDKTEDQANFVISDESLPFWKLLTENEKEYDRITIKNFSDSTNEDTAEYQIFEFKQKTVVFGQ